jgi:hypothetical protein
VDGAVAQSGDDKSWATAFRKTQERIDAASEGDTVIVGEGVYKQGVWFRGPDITLRSRDPLDPAVVAASVIGFGGVIFSGLQEETCVLSGFTIRDGLALYEPERGINGDGTHAPIRNNVLMGNGACEGVRPYFGGREVMPGRWSPRHLSCQRALWPAIFMRGRCV